MSGMNLLGNVRRYAVRAALEIFQGKQAPIGKHIENESYPNVEETLNIPYVNRLGIPLAMDIFKPVGPEYDGKDLPVIVEIHGGGLVTGDRKYALDCSRDFASKGYLVFAIEYRLAPRATVCDEFDDVCAGMDFVGEKLLEYNVDFTRVFLTADSAGAFLGVYAAAMKKSTRLQEVIGHKPSRMTFKALGLSCGMFYTQQDDLLGKYLAAQLYGERYNDSDFLEYMDPEHPEIINNLPPTFMVTSRGDFLNNYTIMFHKALKRAGRTSKMLFYPDVDLFHTFNFADPRDPRSQDANRKMLEFFEEQAAIERNNEKKIKATKARKKEAVNFIKGEFLGKNKLWKSVESICNLNNDNMLSTAIIDDNGTMDYSQMLKMWNRYASAFTGLGINRNNKSIVAIPGAMTTEAIASTYALNMTGATVSLMPYEFMIENDKLFKAIKNENISDLILTAYQADSALVKKLIKDKESLGIKNIIILDTEVNGPFVSEEEIKTSEDNLKDLRKLDVLFISNLLEKCNTASVSYDEDATATSFILHKKSGNDYRAVNFSDADINSYARDICKDLEKEIITDFFEVKAGLSLDIFTSESFVLQLHIPFLIGAAVVTTYKAGYNNDFCKAIERYRITNLIVDESLMNKLEENSEDVFLTSLKYVFAYDKKISNKKLVEYKEFFEDHYGEPTVTKCNYYMDDASKSINYDVDVEEAEIDDVEDGYNGHHSFFNLYAPIIPFKAPVKEKEAEEDKNEENNSKPDGMFKLASMLPDLLALAGTMKGQEDEEAAAKASQIEMMKLFGKLFGASQTDYYYEDM